MCTVRCPLSFQQARRVSISKPSLWDIPEATAPKGVLLSPQAINESRRNSKEASSRRSSTGISFSTSVKILRASQNPRRVSVRGKAPGALPEPVGDADALDNVPMPRSPRFTSSMSVEAQYTILKCYEDRLWRVLTNCYPDYSSLLHRATSPANGYVSLRRQNDSAEEESDDQEDEGDRDSGVEEGYHMRSTRSLPGSLYNHTTSARPHMTQSARLDRHPNVRVPHHKQLALSRRLQMAHKLLDTVAERPTGTGRNEKLNPIQGYNSWTQGWREEFDVKENGNENSGISPPE